MQAAAESAEAQTIRSVQQTLASTNLTSSLLLNPPLSQHGTVSASPQTLQPSLPRSIAPNPWPWDSPWTRWSRRSPSPPTCRRTLGLRWSAPWWARRPPPRWAPQCRRSSSSSSSRCSSCSSSSCSSSSSSSSCSSSIFSTTCSCSSSSSSSISTSSSCSSVSSYSSCSTCNISPSLLPGSTPQSPPRSRPPSLPSGAPSRPLSSTRRRYSLRHRLKYYRRSVFSKDERAGQAVVPRLEESGRQRVHPRRLQLVESVFGGDAERCNDRGGPLQCLLDRQEELNSGAERSRNYSVFNNKSCALLCDGFFIYSGSTYNMWIKPCHES